MKEHRWWHAVVALIFSPVGMVIAGMDIMEQLLFDCETPLSHSRQQFLEKRAAHTDEGEGGGQ
jgi:hypothetical protein